MAVPGLARATIGLGLVATMLTATTALASPATLAGDAAGAAAAGTDRLGCVFTVSPPHIDHSGTSTDGMMKVRAAYRCPRAMPELIMRICLSYWDGAKWIRVHCHPKLVSGTDAIEATVHYKGGCDLGHHLYRNHSHLAVFDSSGRTILNHLGIVKHKRC